METISPEKVLRSYWGYNSFRPPQKQIITHINNGENALVLLPTGGGKSVCYQVPALSKEGICIVISPLVALINDQVKQLKERGVKALAITGGISYSELNDRLDNAIYGNYKFLYLSPERLQQELITERIRQMPVNLIAIDEAHCISQWGNDFRPAYRSCGILKDMFPNIPLVALTATATPEVVKDIKENLHITEAPTFSASFERANLRYWIRPCHDKHYEISRIFHKLSGSGIVYIRSRKKSVTLSQELNQRGISAAFFHGGLSAEEKKSKLEDWLEGKVRVMVATNAFGMGIDKADVRCVIHADLPDSLENYFQESGRAGRDGKESWAMLLYNDADLETLENQFVKTIPDRKFIGLLYNKLCNFLQIAYGDGSGETFQINFNSFCHTYQLNPVAAYNGLQLLDRNSVIRLSEQFRRSVSLQFTVNNHKLFHYMDRNPSYEGLIQLILRTYGGVFDIMTAVNTRLLATKTGMEEKRITAMLHQLATDELIELKVVNADTSITFLQPREDHHTINSIARDIDIQRKNKIERIAHVRSFLDTDTCLSRYLSEYFGQKTASSCGNCSNCSKQKTAKGERDINMVRKVVIHTLSKGPMSSRALVEHLGVPEDKVLHALHTMLQEEEISRNQKNEYYIK
ncbi:RecQ family ATP-dependent DNA helicase [Robertkochia marina]|uniref:ATP-dependent DNA helicase RecQ n=1 Tax=Robertkochia marina TaxID=1227945 RepID=A0A4S3LYG9_9FLAO|nr:ATP-dependent DNA helicase RecQ [Robertkochia marina]THD66650.1 RecQ family ATP-dependent DNA helicase [Robertkochia marina]TRZ45511.1 RecQ family ATP-dependent DNA helicase [Robertkochia marina]